MQYRHQHKCDKFYDILLNYNDTMQMLKVYFSSWHEKKQMMPDSYMSCANQLPDKHTSMLHWT